MEWTIAATVVIALGYWHLRNRRHPGWRLSGDGRSYLLSGYSVFVSSTYWLWHPPVGAWEWAFAVAWAIGGLVAFMLGFHALDRAARERQASPQDSKTCDKSRTSPQPMGRIAPH